MNPVTAANAITGERSTETVHYPITGDPETDTLTGILWVLEQNKITAQSKVRVLRYLAERFQVVAENDRKLEKQWQFPPGLISNPISPSAPWTTSGGTLPVTDPLAGLAPYQPCPPTSSP